MAHSVEVRTPLVDWQLYKQLAPCLAAQNPPRKVDLARLPKTSLPQSVLSRRKTGFSIPIRDWMLASTGSRRRGLRSGAQFAYGRIGNARKALVLITDAFGGQGGIAKFNRDFLGALASNPAYREVVAVPRLEPEVVDEPLPAKLRWDRGGLGGKLRYARHLARMLLRERHFDPIICGHINLLPFAWAARAVTQAPVVLVIHGVDAWQPHRSALVNRLVPKVNCVIAVSETTKKRFAAWSNVSDDRIFVLPNCIDMRRFRPLRKNPELIERYGLDGRRVVMTLTRLSSSERYKGIDQILEVLPALRAEVPDLVYLVVGDGDDRGRLVEKAKALGLDQSVIFAGRITENEKVDHYNLADAFAMPGWGEGFGVVFLEAMACGTPVVGSVLDGSRDALLGGKLGILVDPHDPEDLRRGICNALRRPRKVPLGLDTFSIARFEGHVRGYADRIARCG